MGVLSFGVARGVTPRRRIISTARSGRPPPKSDLRDLSRDVPAAARPARPPAPPHVLCDARGRARGAGRWPHTPRRRVGRRSQSAALAGGGERDFAAPRRRAAAGAAEPHGGAAQAAWHRHHLRRRGARAVERDVPGRAHAPLRATARSRRLAGSTPIRKACCCSPTTARSRPPSANRPVASSGTSCGSRRGAAATRRAARSRRWRKRSCRWASTLDWRDRAAASARDG